MVVFNQLPTRYSEGTASVAANATAVTGTGTNWTVLQPGDLFGVHKGITIPILSIESDTALTLAFNWSGAAQTNAVYCVQLLPRSVGVQEATRQLLLMLANGNLDAFAALIGANDKIPMFTGPGVLTLLDRTALISGADYDVQVNTLAARATYNGSPAGFRVLVSDVGDGRSAIYSKNTNTSADWSAAAYVTGPAGSTPTVTASAAQLAAGATPTAVASPITGGVNIAFGIPAARTSGFPYKWSTTTTDADPGAGLIRANNAALGSATLLFVSKTSAAGSAMATYLLNMASSDSPIKGNLILQRNSDGQTVSFNVTAVTDATNYVKLTVSGQSGLTAIANTADLNFLFTKTGSKGADGAGSGDVSGPASSVLNRIATFGGTTGKVIQDSGVTIGSAAGYNIGTSGATVPLLNTANAWALGQTFAVSAIFNGGLGMGSVTATSAITLTRHLALYGAEYGFSVTSSSLNHVSGSAHNWYGNGTLSATLSVTGDLTLLGELKVPASTTATAMLNVPHGVAPTTLANGDIWTQTTGVFARVNGVTLNLSPALITQALAEAGTDTAIYSWSSLRVRQAIIASPAALLNVEDQTLTGGARVTSKSLGTITTGTLTLDPGDRPLQHYTNNGAHTLAPGTNTGSFMLDIVNGASAGAITVTGWTKVAGDAFTTTSGNAFRLHCSVGNNGSLLIVQALQ